MFLDFLLSVNDGQLLLKITLFPINFLKSWNVEPRPENVHWALPLWRRLEVFNARLQNFWCKRWRNDWFPRVSLCPQRYLQGKTRPEAEMGLQVSKKDDITFIFSILKYFIILILYNNSYLIFDIWYLVCTTWTVTVTSRGKKWWK